jgi:ankyrin repeat protein
VPELISHLIQADCDLNNANFFNCSALFMSSLYGHIEVARLLINAGANVDMVN